MYDILTFGASIDELNTEAIQQAIDAAASDGGGTVVVPAGEFLTGALFLKQCRTSFKRRSGSEIL